MDRLAERDRVRAGAEAFLPPILPLIDWWTERLKQRGIVVTRELIIEPVHPHRLEDNPIKSGLVVHLMGTGVRTGFKLYTLDGYMPDRQDWLAAEIDFQIEEHLLDPEFGTLSEGFKDIGFRRTVYEGRDLPEHCLCCQEAIEGGTEAFTSPYPEDPDWEIWLCQRCFEYWSPRRNLLEEG